jgi:hypothetical protein
MQPYGNEHQMPASPKPYRLTMFDRLGPDAALRVRMFPYAVVAFFALGLMFTALKFKVGYSALLILPLAAAAAAAVTWWTMRFSRAVGDGIGYFVLPSGKSTPYEHQFSLEESLAERGDIAAALESLESAILAIPIVAGNGVRLRIRTAELCIRHGNPKRAAALFREVQQFPALGAAEDLYVSNRLIDLLLGPLDQPARALFELRRIVDRYPKAPSVEHTRVAITRLKERLRADGP